MAKSQAEEAATQRETRARRWRMQSLLLETTSTAPSSRHSRMEMLPVHREALVGGSDLLRERMGMVRLNLAGGEEGAAVDPLPVVYLPESGGEEIHFHQAGMAMAEEVAGEEVGDGSAT